MSFWSESDGIAGYSLAGRGILRKETPRGKRNPQERLPCPEWVTGPGIKRRFPSRETHSDHGMLVHRPVGLPSLSVTPAPGILCRYSLCHNAGLSRPGHPFHCWSEERAWSPVSLVVVDKAGQQLCPVTSSPPLEAA